MPRSLISRASLLCSALAFTAAPVGANATDFVGRFDPSSTIPPTPWSVLQLDADVPATRYQVIAWDGVGAMESIAHASMALLVRPLIVDLTTVPVLCWRWRVDAPLKSADLATRAGDDFAARIYVSLRLPKVAMNVATRARLRFARALYGDHVPDAALNYVWDNRYPIGTVRPNAYTDRARMVVLRSGAADAGRWVEERRDVQADAIAEFGPFHITASSLSLASDTDNTGESARAGFADLHFVTRDQPCAFPEPTNRP